MIELTDRAYEQGRRAAHEYFRRGLTLTDLLSTMSDRPVSLARVLGGQAGDAGLVADAWRLGAREAWPLVASPPGRKG